MLERPEVRQGLSVGLATAAYGFSFGALAVASGLSVAQACATSLLLFSGGSQFAFAGVLGAGGSPAAAVATATLLSVRNALYGLQLRVLSTTGARRLLAAQVTLDESTAVAVAQPSPDRARRGFWVTGLTVFAGWNVTTLLGALLGNALGDPRAYGLDAAAAAAFLGLLWPRLRQARAAVIALAAAVLTVALVPALPVGLPVVAAAVLAAVLGARGGAPEPGASRPAPPARGGPPEPGASRPEPPARGGAPEPGASRSEPPARCGPPEPPARGGPSAPAPGP